MAFTKLTRDVGPFLAVIATILLGPPAAAQAPAEFFKGRQISLIVGAGAGGAYDLVSRTMAQHWGRTIPGNPTFVVSNMHIASGLAMTNYLQNAAAKDGTVIGMGNANIALEPVTKAAKPLATKIAKLAPSA